VSSSHLAPLSSGGFQPVELHTDSPGHPTIRAITEATGAALYVGGDRCPARTTLTRLSGARALVCSVSSMNMLAAYYSERPYVWCADHLVDIDGALSIWGARGDQQLPGSPTRVLRETNRLQRGAPRGFPVPVFGAPVPAREDWFTSTSFAGDSDLVPYGGRRSESTAGFIVTASPQIVGVRPLAVVADRGWPSQLVGNCASYRHDIAAC
jgi:hypothetical protein